MEVSRPIGGDRVEVGDPWPEELSALYEDRYRSLVRTAFALTGAVETAEDIVQECFYSVHRHWATVENPRAYLYRAVVNRSRSWGRRRLVARRVRIDPAPPQAPIELVEFRDALLKLRPRHRAVIVLRYLEDLDDESIAQVLGCARATVRSLAARGLERLREELG